VRVYVWRLLGCVLAGFVLVSMVSYGQSSTDNKTLVLYTSRNEELIKPVIDAYTKKTGVKVTYHTAKAGMLLAKITAQKERQEADLFMTVDAGNLWAAKEAGILQAVSDKALEKKVPAPYRDSEGYWWGVSLRARTLFFHPDKIKPSELSTYAALAEPRFKGKLCMRTSKKVYNQSLVAMLISQYGYEKTLEVVKGWVANLAAPVFSSDTKLIEAVAAGQCAVAIANSYYYGRLLKQDPKFRVKIFWPGQPSSQATQTSAVSSRSAAKDKSKPKDSTQEEAFGVHVNISGVGLLKHTKKVKLAKDFLAYLLADEAQSMFASLNLEYPVVEDVKWDPLLEQWGRFVTSSMPLSVAGQKQQEAIKLMDKAGYR